MSARKILGKEVVLDTTNLARFPGDVKRRMVSAAFQGLKRRVERDPRNASYYDFLSENTSRQPGPERYALVEAFFNHDTSSIKVITELESQVPQRIIDDFTYSGEVLPWQEPLPKTFVRRNRS